jgi:heme/copper-type cytochrome/quinol oxidase subunit 1
MGDFDFSEPARSSPSRVAHYHQTAKSGGTAALFEVLGGLFCQTFGLGHIYAGNVALGLLFMFGYWVVAAINGVLIFAFGLGLLTGLICWVCAMLISPILAAMLCDGR